MEAIAGGQRSNEEQNIDIIRNTIELQREKW